MSRYIPITLIILVLLAGGVFLYTSQSKPKTDEHGEPMMGNQPVAQSHRSYNLEVTSNTDNVQPNQPMTFSFKIKNDKGEVLKNYEIVHEKIMHFIVVRKDLQQFQHIHPTFNQSTGEFGVQVTFPTDGPYRVFPDFTPDDENPQKLTVTLDKDINVGDMSKYQAVAVTPDTQNIKNVNGYQITFNMPSMLNKQNELAYSLTVKQNGQPVTNLEPYLGALGHSVILHEGDLQFIHAHAGEMSSSNSMPGMNHGSGSTSSGPDIEFTTSFPESGVYKIFTQFQHQGKVLTTDYAVKVN